MKEELKKRFKQLGIDVILFLRTIPSSRENNAIANQLVRCSTSVGANYSAACRAKSTKDFINKLKIVEEEADETIYFLDLLNTLYPKKEIEKLIKEADEILAITVSSIKTTRARLNS